MIPQTASEVKRPEPIPAFIVRSVTPDSNAPKDAALALMRAMRLMIEGEE